MGLNKNCLLYFKKILELFTKYKKSLSIFLLKEIFLKL